MSIEELTKTQIILLTLLVSFITSIATGIVTVSLLEQAPPALTQTVNRVVERTVERIVPTQVAGTNTNTVTKETTVVVKDEDLITGSIEKTTPSVVAVSQESFDPQTPNAFLGWGIVLSGEGLIATDSSFVSDGTIYGIETSDGKKWRASAVTQDESKGVALLQVSRAKADEDYLFSKAKLASASALRLGQTVIAFDGIARRTIATAVVSSLNTRPVSADKSANASGTPSSVVVGIDTSAAPSGGATGGPLTNIFGEVVGMRVAPMEGQHPGGYVPVTAVEALAESFLNAVSKK